MLSGCSAASIGLFRELNPGPLAPEVRIMPLDQTAKWMSLNHSKSEATTDCGLRALFWHCLSSRHGPHRLMVRTSRCGRGNPGSTPGGDIFHAAASDEQRSSTLLDFPDFHVQAAVQMCPPLFQVAPQATVGWQLGGNQVGPGGKQLTPGTWWPSSGAC